MDSHLNPKTYIWYERVIYTVLFLYRNIDSQHRQLIPLFFKIIDFFIRLHFFLIYVFWFWNYENDSCETSAFLFLKTL